VVKALHVNDWVSMVRAFAATPKRDRLIGVSVTLAARLLGVSRARVHQLLRSQKLRAVDVYDERHIRIGHMVTLASIERRRRTVRPRRTQWRPNTGIAG
jgi:predicted transcriptional regulator